jgi:hypothetical protein
VEPPAIAPTIITFINNPPFKICDIRRRLNFIQQKWGTSVVDASLSVQKVLLNEVKLLI